MTYGQYRDAKERAEYEAECKIRRERRAQRHLARDKRTSETAAQTDNIGLPPPTPAPTPDPPQRAPVPKEKRLTPEQYRARKGTGASPAKSGGSEEDLTGLEHRQSQWESLKKMNQEAMDSRHAKQMSDLDSSTNEELESIENEFRAAVEKIQEEHRYEREARVAASKGGGVPEGDGGGESPLGKPPPLQHTEEDWHLRQSCQDHYLGQSSQARHRQSSQDRDPGHITGIHGNLRRSGNVDRQRFST